MKDQKYILNVAYEKSHKHTLNAFQSFKEKTCEKKCTSIKKR